MKHTGILNDEEKIGLLKRIAERIAYDTEKFEQAFICNAYESVAKTDSLNMEQHFPELAEAITRAGKVSRKGYVFPCALNFRWENELHLVGRAYIERYNAEKLKIVNEVIQTIKERHT